MTTHLHRQTEKLKKMLLQLCAMVEQSVNDAIEAIQQRQTPLAQRVIDGDEAIDEMEIEIEEECLHILALYQPVAQDLRYVVVALKINNDLERIGDLAVNTAEQAILMAEETPIDHSPFDLSTMTKLVKRMIRQSIDALVRMDTELAQTVRDTDDQVDDLHRQMFEQVESSMYENPQSIRQLNHLIGISRQLERMADHAVNIAEDVLYMAKGKIFRHPTNPLIK